MFLQKNDHGIFEYMIKVNGEIVKLEENHNPLKFSRIFMYLSNPWVSSFEEFGSLKNLKVLMPN